MPGDWQEANDLRCQDMLQTIDGRAYIESYVQHFTHAMKSPLSGVRASLEVLQEDLAASDRQRFADQGIQEAERLRILLDDCLKLAAVENRALEKRPLDIDEVLAAVAERWQQRCPALAIRFQPGPDTVAIEADEHLIHLALDALLENAADFSPPDGIIDIARDEHGVITIRDYGPGIPDYALTRVFERFYSIPPVGSSTKRSGLGCAFVQIMAELHGGSVSLVNADGSNEKGALARLSLSFKSADINHHPT